MRVVILGPGVEPPGGLPADVLDDVARLTRPDVRPDVRPDLKVVYRFVGGGPSAIRSIDDAAAMAPFVVTAAVQAAAEGFDAVIVDCTDDPGADAARGRVSIPVVGAGEALRAAIALAVGPVVVWSGDTLRATGVDELLADAPPGATIALGGTGWSHLADAIRAAGHPLVDPLPAALDRCLTG